jgi:tetratricopeptide (TPR) repeat protein
MDIKKQSLHGDGQQFADEINNQNRDITAGVYVERDNNGNIAGRDINIQYGVPQKVVDRLLKELDDKDVKLQEREGVIANWIQKYNELESQLASRTDDIAKRAKAFLDEGKLEEADKLFEEAQENDLKNAAANVFSRAQIKVLQLDYQTAKNYYQQAVQLAPENPFYLNWLGTHLYTLGEYAQAEPLCQRSLTILEKILGKDHADVAASLNCLAEIYREQKKYEQAETLYKKSLTILENTTNKNHVLIAAVLNNLGSLYQSQEKNQQVESLFQESLINLKKGLSGKNNGSLGSPVKPYKKYVFLNISDNVIA